MGATFIKFGDPPPTLGGEFELEVVRVLREKLSPMFLVISNPTFPTKSSYFYEYDVLVISPFLCEILEIKRFTHYVGVGEDWLDGVNEFRISPVFSILESKARVLKERLLEKPFSWANAPWVDYRVIVGPGQPELKFHFKLHENNKKVLKVNDVIKYYQDKEREYRNWPQHKDFWLKFCQVWSNYAAKFDPQAKTKNKLGRFILRKRLESCDSSYEYLAQDEPPCQIEVHLKEYPFDPIAPKKEIEIYLNKITRDLQVVRKLRHPCIRCVTGHFRTGCSLVQISDWFEGKPLEKIWQGLLILSLNEKIGLMLKIVQGLLFCHSKGIFHRNINGANILINKELDDIRITGFEFAKDLGLTGTVSDATLEERDPRLIPCEAMLKRVDSQENYRVQDIFQVGLLFYRIIENGDWPFEDVLDYCTGKYRVRMPHIHKGEPGFQALVKLIMEMFAANPQDRPDPLAKVEGIITHILGNV